MRKHTFIIGIVSSTSFIAGLVLKYLHLPPAGLLLSLGMLIFLLGFGISFLVDRLTVESRKSFRIALIMLTISISLLLAGVVLKILHLPAATLSSYTGVISFLIFAVYFNREIEGRKLKIRKDRQLASILFTDIKGFTRMMGEDEDRGLMALEQNRRIQKRIVRKYRGKWLKEMGDGTVSIFYTASEAILCCLEIQEVVKQKDLFKLRMGIHVSEIVFTDKDVFGDGVNVASRISEKADGGEICFSETVFHNIKNREDLRISSLGRHEFKNVDYSLEIYKIDTNRRFQV